jgi:DNA repair exonuclease SbcCD ATPase subunit
VEELELRGQIGRIFAEIRAQVRSGNEGRALVLINERLRMADQLERLEAELAEVRAEAAEATLHLIASADELRALERERLRTTATLANAKARQRAQQLSEKEEEQRSSLDRVRAEVSRVVNESHLDRELGLDHLALELGEGAGERARTELALMRASMKPRSVA